MRSPPSLPMAPRARISRASCAARPTWRARWRGSRSAAAGRAISRPCATALSRRTRRWRGLPRWNSRPPRSRSIMTALRRPARELAQEFERALAEQLPLIKRDGGFVRARLRGRARRDAQPARRLAARGRRDAGALRRRHGHQGPEDPAQQRARLFRRGHRPARRQADVAAAERDLHPSPDPGRAGALHHRRTRRDRGQDRQRRRPRARSRTRDLRSAAARGRWRRAIELRAAAHAFAMLDVATALAKLAVERQLRAARGRRLARLRDRRRPASGGRTGAAARRPALHRQRLRPVAGARRSNRARSGWSPVPTWPASRPSCARTR